MIGVARWPEPKEDSGLVANSRVLSTMVDFGRLAPRSVAG